MIDANQVWDVQEVIEYVALLEEIAWCVRMPSSIQLWRKTSLMIGLLRNLRLQMIYLGTVRSDARSRKMGLASRRASVHTIGWFKQLLHDGADIKLTCCSHVYVL